MNLPNPSQPNPLAAVALLHDDRRFSPTDRQLQLYQALLGAPCHAPDANPHADRLTLSGGAYPLFEQKADQLPLVAMRLDCTPEFAMTTRRTSADRSNEALDLLLNVVLFRGMPRPMLLDLASKLRPVRYRAHTDIFHEGDEGATLYIVLKGAVKIFIPSLDGREVVLAVHRKYDLLGEMSLLDEFPRSASATTIEDTEAVSLSRHDFLSVLDRHPEAQRAIIDVLVARLRATNQSIQDAYLLDVPGRLARRLLSIAEEHGDETDDGIDIGLRVSQQELANMIGASRVAVNKQLQQWRKQNVVDVNRQRVTILDPAALEREFSLTQ